MPNLHSYTHCQVTQAKSWQRVCLPKRKTDQQTDEEKEAQGGNSLYVAIAVEVVNRRPVFLRNFVLNGKESASNPLQLIHAKRYQ